MSFRNANLPSGLVAVTPGAGALNLVGFQVGGAGTVTVTDSLGVSTTITCIAGQVIMARIVAITAATATNIVGFVP